MKRKLEITELIFKIISYTCLTVFALCCLYPFVYAISASISGREAVEYGRVVLFPMDIQFDAFSRMFNNSMFWNSYTNTLFLTFYGTIWALFFSILGGYAGDRRRGSRFACGRRTVDPPLLGSTRAVGLLLFKRPRIQFSVYRFQRLSSA